jgi:hypothetical protein
MAGRTLTVDPQSSNGSIVRWHFSVNPDKSVLLALSGIGPPPQSLTLTANVLIAPQLWQQIVDFVREESWGSVDAAIAEVMKDSGA